ncbi:hypothetical protein DFJ73DRAFT_935511 [Zopfochytrium polystomum]|nr:hypothetical protein DFJ73DRAFT_935511 [Zopfochytrium polystomum]
MLMMATTTTATASAPSSSSSSSLPLLPAEAGAASNAAAEAAFAATLPQQQLQLDAATLSISAIKENYETTSDSNYELFKLLYDGLLAHAPLPAIFDAAARESRTVRVLDASGSSMSWAVEFAKAYPCAEVVVLNPITTREDAPTNVTIARGPAQNVPFPDKHFDLLHSYGVFIAQPAKETDSILTEFKRVVRPGGFVELYEPYAIIQRCGPLGRSLNDAVVAAFDILKAKARIALDLDDLLYSHGLGAVDEGNRAVTIVPSDPQLGDACYQHLRSIFLAMGPLLAALGLFSEDALRDTMDRARDEFQELQSYHNWFYAVGQVA